MAAAGASELSDVLAIQRLKYAYFRHLDLKEIQALGELLTEDVTAAYGDADEELHGRQAVVEWLQGALGGPHIITLHNGHHPEIEVTGDTATGTWYLLDRVVIPSADLEIGGSAFYADRYVRTGAGWKISYTGYRRVFEEQRRHSTGESLLFKSRFDEPSD